MQQVAETSSLSLWDRVQLARHKDRPHTADYIRHMCKCFFELRGDRRYGDDPALIGGVATFAGGTIVIIGHQKGRTIEQRRRCNSGMPHPEGYRKAQRLMLHAEKFGFPVVCFIDTPGAFPGLEAEQRGQAQTIAETFAVMVRLRVPIVAVIIGEGGSGDALAFGLTDRVLMLEHSIYTAIVPKVTASYLWHNNILAAQATAQDLLKLGVVSRIVPEPAGGAHLDHAASSRLLAEHLHIALAELGVTPICNLVELRRTKFRNIEPCTLF